MGGSEAWSKGSTLRLFYVRYSALPISHEHQFDTRNIATGDPAIQLVVKRFTVSGVPDTRVGVGRCQRRLSAALRK